MKKRFFAALGCIAILLCALPVPVFADMGPKPSVVVDFIGLGDTRCYATLLSETPSTGPHSAVGEYPDNERYHERDAEYAVWQKFASYQDADGYYFLQYFGDCTETARFEWGYYPPGKFKILLYFPEEDRFLAGGQVYERYAFNSYFTVDISHLGKEDETPPEEEIALVKSYDYLGELLSLLVRVVATVAVELLVALLFRLYAKKQLFFIFCVNIATQIILNVLLNVIHYYNGDLSFVVFYALLELLVFAVEAVLYSVYLKRYAAKPMKKWVAPVYALIANAASFAVGFWIARIVPGIF